ncbi:MAG: hypothetical protein ACLFPE_03585 [Bacteroidales bacterium]
MKKLNGKIELFVETTKNGTVAYSIIYPISATGNSDQELADNALVAARRYFEIWGIRITWQNIQMRIELHKNHCENGFLNPRFFAEKAIRNRALLS